MPYGLCLTCSIESILHTGLPTLSPLALFATASTRLAHPRRDDGKPGIGEHPHGERQQSGGHVESSDGPPGSARP